MNNSYREALKKERAKLERLVDEALENGTPINETHAIMEQCRKVDALVVKVIEEGEEG